MRIRNYLRLEDRPLSDIPCACGCGKMARVNSKLNNAECQGRYKKIAMAIWRENHKEKTTPVERRSWADRREEILNRYGIKKGDE